MRSSILPAFLNEAAERLRLNGVDSPRVNAESLLAHVLGIRRSHLYVKDFSITPEKESSFFELLERRCAHVPLQYLVGETEFMEAEIHCASSALIPRPETEGLVERAVSFLKQKEPSNLHVLEIGTGTGCISIALAMEFPSARITATDLSPDALQLAAENAVRNGVEGRIQFIEADLFPESSGELYDLIISNPPYVSEAEWEVLPREVKDHEPKMALVGGARGTEVIERILAGSKERLKPEGGLFLEIGEAQGAVLLEIGALPNSSVKKDLAGRDRYFIAAPVDR